MQAVYELATVRPFIPAKAKYTLRELEIYGHGYYEALAAALRVMKPAAKRWEGRMRISERPHLVGGEPGGRVAAPAGDGEPDRVPVVVFWLIVTTGAIFVLELLGVMAAAIYHLVR
jgi:hypothetical protein